MDVERICREELVKRNERIIIIIIIIPSSCVYFASTVVLSRGGRSEILFVLSLFGRFVQRFIAGTVESRTLPKNH
jgi:hypothetical protein